MSHWIPDSSNLVVIHLFIDLGIRDGLFKNLNDQIIVVKQVTSVITIHFISQFVNSPDDGIRNFENICK